MASILQRPARISAGSRRSARCTPMAVARPVQPTPTTSIPAAAVSALQRVVLPGIMASMLLVSPLVPSASARLDLPNKEVDDATSPLIQAMLKRSAENKERYDKERLQDYYRRNFKEYFEFESGQAKVGKARGLSTETQQAILKWLEENK